RLSGSVVTAFSLATCALAQQVTKQFPTDSRPAPVAPSVATADGPRVELSTRLWDFGKLWYGDPCTTDVLIKNVGKAPLTIVNVKSSCGCTAARPNRSLLQPG